MNSQLDLTVIIAEFSHACFVLISCNKGYNNNDNNNNNNSLFQTLVYG